MFTLVIKAAAARQLIIYSGRVAAFWAVRRFRANAGLDHQSRHCARVLREILRVSDISAGDLCRILDVGRLQGLRLRYTIGPWTLQGIATVAVKSGRDPVTVLRAAIA